MVVNISQISGHSSAGRQKKNASLHFRRPLLTHWSHMDYFFMMDGCAFWGFKNSVYYSIPL